MASFGLHKDTKDEWYWLFMADNGKVICKSTDGYKNRTDCIHSIKLVKTLAPKAIVLDCTKKPAETVVV